MSECRQKWCNTFKPIFPINNNYKPQVKHKKQEDSERLINVVGPNKNLKIQETARKKIKQIYRW
jgi:hypothetical protein